MRLSTRIIKAAPVIKRAAAVIKRVAAVIERTPAIVEGAPIVERTPRFVCRILLVLIVAKRIIVLLVRDGPGRAQQPLILLHVVHELPFLVLLAFVVDLD